MGGYGSGRCYSRYTKQTVEDSKTIDIDWLRRQKTQQGILSWSRGGKSTGRINYKWYGDKGFVLYYLVTKNEGKTLKVEERVNIDKTPLHFGGERHWMTCPRCGRRVTKLHLPPGEIYFGCRKCYDLTYQSCQDSHKFDSLYVFLARDMKVSVKDIKKSLKC